MGNNVIGIVAAVVGLAWTVMLWRVVRQMQALAGVEDRVARLTEALSLLTDTAETGFRTLSDQAGIAMPASARVRKAAASATTTGRVVRAARKGKTTFEIAAAERVAEGEVRLRLNMAEAATVGGKSTRAAAPAFVSRHVKPVVPAGQAVPAKPAAAAVPGAQTRSGMASAPNAQARTVVATAPSAPARSALPGLPGAPTNGVAAPALAGPLAADAAAKASQKRKGSHGTVRLA